MIEDKTIANYYSNFFIKTGNKTVYIVETKGREDLYDPLKIKRLAQKRKGPVHKIIKFLTTGYYTDQYKHCLMIAIC